MSGIKKRFLATYSEAVRDQAASVFVGAGASMAAGYPSWKGLLREIAEDLGLKVDDIGDLTALAEWSRVQSGSRNRVIRVIEDEIGKNHPVPPSLSMLVKMPIRSFWTTNFDRLIERAFEDIGRPYRPISTKDGLALRAKPGVANIYKMHGSITEPNDVVITTDDFDRYRNKRGAFIPLLQGSMTNQSMLFYGLSFNDPNLKHVFRLIRENFQETVPEHFAIARRPDRSDRDIPTSDVFEARMKEHEYWSRDLQRYGLQVVDIEDWNEVPELLRQVERRVAARRVWISGSWPAGYPGEAQVGDAIASIARSLAHADFDLVTGAGLGIGPRSIAGFLDGLRQRGGWDLERRLVVRPFPQNARDLKAPLPEHWQALRLELASASGAIVLIGGTKSDGGGVSNSDGLKSEMEMARDVGSFILPIGSFGGMAAAVSEELRGSQLPHTGLSARRPKDDDLDFLSSSTDPNALASRVSDILTAFADGKS